MESCNTAEIEKIENGSVQENVTLRFRSAELATKADYPAGDADGDYNENLIKTVDYFVYAKDPVTNKTETAVLQGRFDFGDGFDASIDTEIKDNIKNIDLKETSLMIKDAAGKITGSNPAYLYVLANMPADFTPTETGYKYTDSEGTEQTVTNTLENLEAIQVVTAFNESLKDGKFAPQESFIMKGAVSDPIALSSEGPVDVTVELTRIAAKVTVDMNIIEIMEEYFVSEGGAPVYQGTWVPNTERMQAYLQFANKKGTIDGSYEDKTWNANDYFMYNRYAFVPTTADEPGSFKEPKRYPNGVQYQDEDGNPIYVEYPAYKVTGTPFYSYPTTWDTKDSHAPFIKVILPWVKYDFAEEYRGLNDEGNEDLRATVVEALKGFPATTTYGPRVTGQDKIADTGGKEFFYKINIPIKEGEPIALQANGWHKIDLSIAILGGSDDEVSVEIAGDYYVVDWSDPDEVLGGDINAGRYIDVVSSKTESVGTRRYYVFEGNAVEEIEIPVSSSHDLSVVTTGTYAPTATYLNYADEDPAVGNLTYSTTSDQGVNYKITPDGHISVTLSHQLVANLNDKQAKDVSPITYRFRIQHKDNASYFRDIEIIQYPTLYIVNDPNSDGHKTGTGSSNHHGYVYVNGGQNNTNTNWYYVRQELPSSGTGSNYNPNMYVLTTSSLSGTNYIIGDPRGDTLSEGTPGWVSRRSVENMSGTRTLGTKYRRTEKSDRTLNMIAPKIRVASSWGAARNYTFDNASRRCASYQEDGIPAGRWRLPTEAEVQFLITLSSKRLIPVLYGSLPSGNEQSSSTTYWTGNGTITVTYYRNGTSNVSVNHSSTATQSGTNFIRCVYDEWYWGSTTNSDAVRAQYRGGFTWGDEI